MIVVTAVVFGCTAILGYLAGEYMDEHYEWFHNLKRRLHGKGRGK